MNLGRELVRLRLERAYFKAAGRRTGGSFFRNLGSSPDRIAGRLKDGRLAVLYIRIVFEALPASYCREQYGVAYPPPNIAFSDYGWSLYEEKARGKTPDKAPASKGSED